jgi:hypothetical protein
MAVVGNGFQPFRRAALRQAQGDHPLPPPAGDKRNEVVGRGPRTRRFSGNERNQANATTRAVPERAAFLFGLFGEQSLQRGTVAWLDYVGSDSFEQSLQRNSPYIASM